MPLFIHCNRKPKRERSFMISHWHSAGGPDLHGFDPIRCEIRVSHVCCGCKGEWVISVMNEATVTCCLVMEDG